MTTIHYFIEQTKINVTGKKITYTQNIEILCGATTGEADNRKKYVTCKKCKNMIRLNGDINNV